MTVRGHLRIQFWVETWLAAVTGLLFVLSLFWPEWLEALGFDPDHGSGSVLAARLEWRRAATAST
jgi:hypothetical protein